MYPGESKPPFYLLTGLIIGVILGVLFAWMIIPVEPIDLSPVTLRDDFKDEYRELIAFAYLSNGDLGRAEARLDLLGEDNHARTLEILAQEAMGQFAQEHIARALGLLAQDLEQYPESTQQFLLTEQTETEVSNTPPDNSTENVDIASESEPTLQSTLIPEETATGIFLPTSITNPTDIPTSTPIETEEPEKNYIVTKMEKLCNGNSSYPMIEIYVFANGSQIPWVEVEVDWASGADRFYTGLKPDIGIGYADFEMNQQVLYNVRLSENSEMVEEISWAECVAVDGNIYWGGWEINFSAD